jgi:phosphatidylserine/phosphatidylglycerophosphate/cardiolipin synthase-like enzyme
VATNSQAQIGEVINEHFDRLYFHLGNRLLSEGIVGIAAGREKDYAKFDEATEKVRLLTENAARELGEDLASPDFGRKYLSTGFVDQEVNFVTTVENLVRTQQDLASIRDGMNTPKSVAQILREQEATANSRALLNQVAKHLMSETQEVTVVSPYLYLSERDMVVIKAWLKRDPKRRFVVYTNSVLTSDNAPAQALVDLVTAPRLVLDPDIRDQVQMFEYGRIDDKALGGEKAYGKLHFKGAFFKGQGVSLVTTYNKDPRSQIINSESGFVIKGTEYSAEMERNIADILNNTFN